MKGDIDMKINVEWVTNEFTNKELIFDYVGKEDEIIKSDFNKISDILVDAMRKGEIKHFLVSIEW